MQVFSGHTAPLTSGGFTPDGKYVVTGSEDGSLIVWDPKTASPISKFTGQDSRFNQAELTSVGFANDSAILLSGSSDGVVKVVHGLNGKVKSKSKSRKKQRNKETNQKKKKKKKIISSLESHTDSVESIEFSKV